MLTEEVDQFRAVFNCEDFQENPGKAILDHIKTTIQPIEEPKGKYKYDPSKVRKQKNEEAKKQAEQRSSKKGQLEQLTEFQKNLEARMNPYPVGKGADKKKTPAKGRQAGGKPKKALTKKEKPWLQA
eukprot:Sspe_Gene.76929::Locus_48044_Transcript_1_1_Confidence_1.000_Length_942::g.76929::m.76929